MTVEEVSIGSLKSLLGRTQFLDPSEITDNDKTPSIDGNIVVYNNTNRNKANIIGRVPVQVKGIQSEDLHDDVIQYDVCISDLQNFLHDGGALLFVVYVSNDKEKIFFRRLAPYDINEILKDVPDDQKTIRIKCYCFPDTYEEIDSEVISFLGDCNKQTLIRDGKNRSISEISNVIDKSQLEYNIHFTNIGKDKDPIEYFLKHDTYLYIENRDLNISFPIERLQKASLVEIKKPSIVKVGEKTYFTEIYIKYSEKTQETRLGTCVTFIFDNINCTAKMSFKAVGNLEERLTGEQFLYDFLTKREMSVNGFSLNFPFIEGDISNQFDLDTLKREIDYLHRIKDTLQFYGVLSALDISTMSQKDNMHLKILMVAKDHGSVKLNELIKDRMVRFQISNIWLLLDFMQVKEREYVINSFFKSEIPCRYKNDEEDISYPTSQFSMMSIDDFVRMSNIDYKKIEGDISLFNTQEHSEQMRLIMLRMLCAYDKTGNRLLLESAKRMARAIKKKGFCVYEDLINVIQCNARVRSINKTERESLNKIIKDENANALLHLAAYLLLGKIDEARTVYSKLDTNTKEIFDEYPISRFWESGTQFNTVN